MDHLFDGIDSTNLDVELTGRHPYVGGSSPWNLGASGSGQDVLISTMRVARTVLGAVVGSAVGVLLATAAALWVQTRSPYSRGAIIGVIVGVLYFRKVAVYLLEPADPRQMLRICFTVGLIGLGFGVFHWHYKGAILGACGGVVLAALVHISLIRKVSQPPHINRDEQM